MCYIYISSLILPFAVDYLFHPQSSLKKWELRGKFELLISESAKKDDYNDIKIRPARLSITGAAGVILCFFDKDDIGFNKGGSLVIK